MKILLDAQLSHEVARLLRERGYDADAITTREDLPGNTADAVVMELAHQEGRAVVTNNVKDFRPIAAQRLQSGEGHSGLILVSPNTKRTKAANETLADAIQAHIDANPDGLSDSERWI